MDAPTIVFVAAVLTGVGAFLTGLGSLRLAHQQTETERDMRLRLERLVADVMGADTLVYLEPHATKDGGFRYYIRQWGDRPTFDVVVRIQNAAGKMLAGPYVVGTVIRHRGLDWTIPAGPNDDPWPLKFTHPPPPGPVFQEFTVEVGARNGVFVQRLRVWSANGRWHTDSRSGAGAELLRLPDDFREIQDLGFLNDVTMHGTLSDGNRNG